MPFLLSSQQGEAARALLSYVASLDLPGPEAQLVAAVVAIRAARGGIGNFTGTDLSALRLGDAPAAIDALRGLGWRVDEALLSGDPSVPIPIGVPDLAEGKAHPLTFSKSSRSRVSGWTARTLTAKPVKKLPPAARLAGLFIAAHNTSTIDGPIPPELPEACRAALPDLLRKGFLAELSDDSCRLGPAVRHLSGTRDPVEEEKAAQLAKREGDAVPASTPAFRFSEEDWTQWKSSISPALRRHVEAVEYCAVCALHPERVAEAFMVPSHPKAPRRKTENRYEEWKSEHPERGMGAAEFTVAFRAEHGHGPSYRQLCGGLGWDLKRSLLTLVVQRLLGDEWLTDTAPVPWTLRPGAAAQARGAALPGARGAETTARRRP
ncbi:hypothetical protein GBW32_15510 [Streptomyces tsukubensis]|uniref:Uncharacterized protein n=1 Tax=Streptomyces tsukubensis TaxID=83656 RepID=A0A1V4A0N8_9ACTN|nr:hypothetical protein B1H18_29975 [Streptomyces tsukubensis]QFR97777.1 hypothetical protein GBW32_15510 [Streptomyces tsukubensis]